MAGLEASGLAHMVELISTDPLHLLVGFLIRLKYLTGVGRSSVKISEAGCSCSAPVWVRPDPGCPGG